MTGGVFSSLHPFLEGGPINGRKMANRGFILALLKADPFAEYHFFVGDPPGLRRELQPHAHLPALKRGALKIMGRPQLPQCLKNNKYAAMHFSDPFTGMADAARLRNRFSPHIFPITATNHTISYAQYPKGFLEMIWAGCSARDAIGANSRAAAAAMENIFAFLRASFNMDCGLHRAPGLKIAPMGVFAENFSAGDEAARRGMRARLGCADDQTMFLLFGRITPQDKMDPLPALHAMRRVKEARPDLGLKLVISGFAAPGDGTADFLSAVAGGDDLDVDVLASPSEEDKKSLFAAADVFISPSDCIQETFGLALLEAGAAALPCIAADWDGYRDIIEHEATGLLIPTLAAADTPDLDAMAGVLFDNQHHFLRAQRTAVLIPELAGAMIRLAENPHLRARMGRAAFERVAACFTWEKAVERWLEIWAELAAAPLSREEEERLRAAAHPLALPFGRIFAPYAARDLENGPRLRCTALGDKARSRRFPLSACLYAGLEEQAKKDDIYKMLTLARKDISAGDLAARLGLGREQGQGLILWALKQDLLEARE